MIKLIPKNKVSDFEIDSATFRIKYITPYELNMIIHANTSNTGVNWIDVGLDVLKLKLVGWSGVYDEDGNEVQFSEDLIDALPNRIQLELYNEITKYAMERIEQDEVIEKNL